MAKRFWNHLLDLLFPPKCVFCGKLLGDGERGYCARCQTALPWTGHTDFGQSCEFVSLCVSPLWYRDAVPASFHRYKFGGRTGYAKVYGKLMAQCVRDHLGDRYDLITWVPLSARRKASRGFDQAFLLAQAAALELDDVAAETLRKQQEVAAQSSLTDDERRRANVFGAYQAPDPELVSGKRILLVDDVITTGSTLSECARILRTAGAADVVAVTLARARG